MLLNRNFIDKVSPALIVFVIAAIIDYLSNSNKIPNSFKNLRSQ